jgi:hypothetical protein
VNPLSNPAYDILTDLEEGGLETKVLTADTLGGLKVSTVQENIAYLNLLIYGDSGAGKTLLAGSAWEVPEMRPVLVIDIEGGTLTLREKFPEVEVVRVASWTDMQKVYDELFKGTEYKTVVLDSLSEIQKFSMGQIMKSVKREDPNRDEEVPGIREWGKNLWQVRSVVRGFRDLPYHTIFTALASHERDPRNGLDKTALGLQGQGKNEVPGFVDFVLYLYVKRIDDQAKRMLLTKMTDKEVAKDRSDKLPQVVEQPTMKLIYDYVFSKGTEE